jgi:hypothetical protein
MPNTEGYRARPERQLREHLQELRAGGLRFDDAWQLAFRRVKFSHETHVRRGQKSVLLSEVVLTEFRLAYEGRPSTLSNMIEALRPVLEQELFEEPAFQMGDFVPVGALPTAKRVEPDMDHRPRVH